MPLPNPSLERASAREQFSIGKEVDTQYASLVRSASVSRTESRVSDVRLRDADDKTAQLQSKNSSLLDTSYELVVEQNRLIREIINALSGAQGGGGGPDSSGRIPRPRPRIRIPVRRGPRRYGAARETLARRRLQRIRDSQRQRRVDNFRRMIGLPPLNRQQPQAERVRTEALSRQTRMRELQEDNANRLRNLTAAQREALQRRGITINSNGVAQRAPGPNERGRPFMSAAGLNQALDEVRREEMGGRNVRRPSAFGSGARIAGAGAGGAIIGGLGAGLFANAVARGALRLIPGAEMLTEDQRREIVSGATREAAVTGAVTAAGVAASIAAVREIAVRMFPTYASRITSRFIPGAGAAIGAYDAYQRASRGDVEGAMIAAGGAIAGVVATTVALTGVGIPVAAGAFGAQIAATIALVIRDFKGALYEAAYHVPPYRDGSPDRAQRMRNVETVIDEMIGELLRSNSQSEEREVERLQRENLARLAREDPEFGRTEIDDVERIRILTQRLEITRRMQRGDRVSPTALDSINRQLQVYDRERGRSVPATEQRQRGPGLRRSELFVLMSYGSEESQTSSDDETYEFDELTFDAQTIVFEGEIASSQTSLAGMTGGGMATQMGASNLLQQASFPGGGVAIFGGGAAGGGGFFGALRAQESGTNDVARNPNSTATGRYQFIDETWLQFARENPNLFAGMNQQQILAARGNGQLQEMAVRWYAARNATALSRAGLPVNDATVALSHFLGVGGAISVLRANPNTPLEQILSAGVMSANGRVLQGRTAGQLVAMYAQRYGAGSSFSGGQVQNPGTGGDLVRRGTDAEAETQRIRRQRITPPAQQQQIPPTMPMQQQNDRREQWVEVPLRQRLLGLVETAVG